MIPGRQPAIGPGPGLRPAYDLSRAVAHPGVGAEWYQERIQKGRSPYQARKEVAKLLGHGRDDVTHIYLASLKKKGGDGDG